MADHSGREQLLRDDSAKRVADVAGACERLATSITEHKSEAQILDILRQVESLCKTVASEMGPDQEIRTTLLNLRTALDAWHKVWPRLSHDRQTGPSFRAAVVRECGLWSRQLRALAKAATLGRLAPWQQKGA